MKEININIEGYNVNGICVGCLNYNRKMYDNSEIKECFKILGNIDVPDGLTAQVCWECLAAVKSVMRFQRQMLNAYDVLIKYSKQHTFLNSPKDLTQYSVTRLSTSSVNLTDNLTLEVELKKESEKTLFEEEKLNTELTYEESIKEEFDGHTSDYPQDIPQDVSSDEDMQLIQIKEQKEKKDRKKKKKERHTFLNSPKDLTQYSVTRLSTSSVNLTDNLTLEVELKKESEKTLFEEEKLNAELTYEESIKEEFDGHTSDYPQDIPQDVSSDEDMQLIQIKEQKEKKDRKKKKKEREKKPTEVKSRKLKNLPKDIVELYTMTEEEMWSVRSSDINSEGFKRLKHSCEHCVIGFNTQKLKEFHDNGKHNPKLGRSHQCDVCKAYFHTKDTLSVHRSLHLCAYRCRRCGTLTTMKRLMIEHGCTKVHEYACSQCGNVFGSKSKLSYHRRTSCSAKPQCDCCGKVFANKMTLKYHLKLLPQKKDDKPKEKLYIPCKGCNKVFHSNKSYRAHVVIHEGHNYPCPICGKLFLWKRNLSRHTRAHKDKDTGAMHQCRECNKTFASRDCYNNHMKLSKRHASESTYVHECEYCGKKFATKWCMVDHVDWDHLKRVKYQCSYCFKAFKTAKIMVAHINNIHGGRRLEPDGEHLCEVCGKSYKSVKRLKAHVWAMHTQRSAAKSFKCSLCSASFTWQTSIYKHMKMMHSNKITKTTRPAPALKQESYDLQFYSHTMPVQQNIV